MYKKRRKISKTKITKREAVKSGSRNRRKEEGGDEKRTKEKILAR